LLQSLDGLVVSRARSSAKRHGRRSILARLGAAMFGAAAGATLPFDRAYGATEDDDVNDDTACTYWRYCALDGLLCTTMGGTKTSCPVGSEASVVSWVGTCRNPNDEREYMISYHDCCGNVLYTGAQFCLRSKGERPGYNMGLHNDINWCMANENKGYHCTAAVVVGVSE
jgi:methylamine dehydrogenase light chain